MNIFSSVIRYGIKIEVFNIVSTSKVPYSRAFVKKHDNVCHAGTVSNAKVRGAVPALRRCATARHGVRLIRITSVQYALCGILRLSYIPNEAYY